jgi:hypothetical protein
MMIHGLARNAKKQSDELLWNVAVIPTPEFFAYRKDLFADRVGFEEVDSLRHAGELVSEFAGYILKVQTIRGNRPKRAKGPAIGMNLKQTACMIQ